jgi:hypothetical protein
MLRCKNRRPKNGRISEEDMLKRRELAGLGIGAMMAAGAATRATAQTADKPVRVILPMQAGSSVDASVA